MNWDEINSVSTQPTYRMNFAIGATPVKVVDKPRMINFSENPDAAAIDYEMKCFTLLERIRWSKRTPRQILRYRVEQVVRYLRMSNEANIKENKFVITQYLNEYIFEIITKLMNDPKVAMINLVKELGLTAIIRNLRSTYKLQMILLRTKREFKNRKYMSKQIQDMLSEAYRNFFDEFLASLEKRYLPINKQGILSGSTTVNEENNIKETSQAGYRLASFSESDKNIEDAICDVIDSDSGDSTKVTSILDGLSSKDVVKDPLLDDPKLTELVNEVITEKTPETKNKLNDYLTTTVQFSNELKTPCFNIYWEDISNEPTKTTAEVVNKVSEPNDTLDEFDILREVPNGDLLVNEPDYKVGTGIDNFGKKFGFVATKINKQFSIKFYKITQSNYKNFSGWSKVPFKVIVSTNK